VTAVYDRHSYDPEKRIALEAWGRRLEAIVSRLPKKGRIVALTARGRAFHPEVTRDKALLAKGGAVPPWRISY
jgi:hypothetical protein